MITNRRNFLMGCSTAIAAMAGARLGPMAFAADGAGGGGEVLVFVFLRGGMDGLSLVPPISGADRAFYEEARPVLKVPLTGTSAALPLDGRFGFHPSARGFYELFQAQRLAVINAVGASGSRSHFDAMRSIELGTPGNKALSTGWLARHLKTSSLPSTILMPALAMGGTAPTSLQGSPETVNLASVSQFSLSNIGHWSWASGDQRTTLRRLYARGSSPVHLSGIQALNAAGLIETQTAGTYKPSIGVTYPGGGFAEQLKLIAQMIKLEVGLRVATIDLGGWDTHENQGNQTNGFFSGLVRTLSDSLRAFYQDLERASDSTLAQRLTIVVQSEFGRRVQENAQAGTDHGTANPMLVIGGRVMPGVYGNWPGLHPDQRFEGADLAPTTDYRTVLSEILIRRFGNTNLGDVFPSFTNYQPLDFMMGPDLAPNYVTKRPPAPGNFAIRRTGASSIRLSWTPSENASNYRLEKRAEGSADWAHAAILTSDSVQYDDYAAGSTQAEYRVQAYNTGGDSPYTPNVKLAEPPLTPVEQWRLEHFGTAENSGIAADSHIASSDGMNNFTKYALGLNPTFPAPFISGYSPGRPKTEKQGTLFSVIFNRPLSRTEARFEVLHSTDLKTWAPVADQAEGVQDGMERRRASVPATGGRQFLKVNAVRA